MIDRHLLDTLGPTPLVRLSLNRAPSVEFLAKLELCNPTGSVKDRAAAYALEKGLATGQIASGAYIVESSSGSFGVALAAYCKYYDLRFHCVVDPRISPMNERQIGALATTVVKVQERDSRGGYLQTRLAAVRDFLAAEPRAYWTNQYANPLVADAYYHTLGVEICNAVPQLDFIFIPVSSGGTIAGLSRRVKERFPSCRVIAVDCEGSVVFGGTARSRYIPGIGSSIVPPILETARIDDVVIIDEWSAIDACNRLLSQHGVFAGGSSGFVLAAIEKYFAGQGGVVRRPVVVGIFPDRGERYADTIYDPAWCERLRAGRIGEDEGIHGS